MKIAMSEPEEIKLQMTAMIDIVFQLLVFFIMTFRVVVMEGDFSIRMPLASANAEELDTVLPDEIYVQLRAAENGEISSISIRDGQTFADQDPNQMFAQLTDYVERKLAGAVNPQEAKKTEVEFDIDYNLKYKYTVKGIEAVSGRILPDGSVKKLIEKIKFKDNSQRRL